MEEKEPYQRTNPKQRKRERESERDSVKNKGEYIYEKNYQDSRRERDAVVIKRQTIRNSARVKSKLRLLPFGCC